jgi:hypothetical protein
MEVLMQVQMLLMLIRTHWSCISLQIDNQATP